MNTTFVSYIRKQLSHVCVGVSRCVRVLVYQLLWQRDPLHGIWVLVGTAQDDAWACWQGSACIELGRIGCMLDQQCLCIASVGSDTEDPACLPWLHVCHVTGDTRLAGGAGCVSRRSLIAGRFYVGGSWRWYC
jgi:hypothetical protein